MEKSANNKIAAAAVILSGILWGTSCIFIKQMSLFGLGSMPQAAFKVIIPAVCFTVFLAIRNPHKLRINPKDIWMFAGTGLVSVTIFTWLHYYAMIEGEASTSIALLYTSPVFVMLIAAVLFREKITTLKIIATAVTFIGCYLVSGAFGSQAALSKKVLIAGIASGFVYGLYTIFARIALAKYDALTVTTYTFILATIGTVPFGHIDEGITLMAEQPVLIALCFGKAIISTMIPYVLYTWGLKHIEAGKAAVFVAIEPLVGALIGIFLFEENADAVKLIGIGLILAAVVLISKNNKG